MDIHSELVCLWIGHVHGAWAETIVREVAMDQWYSYTSDPNIERLVKTLTELRGRIGDDESALSRAVDDLVDALKDGPPAKPGLT